MTDQDETMTNDLPKYYFRIRENGAFVFQVGTDNPHGRIEMDQIATVNVRNGEIRPHGERLLSEADMAAISAWLEERVATLARRRLDDVQRLIESLNVTAHWANARATAEELEAVTDPLLMAMHDLRSVLVRKKAERIAGKI